MNAFETDFGDIVNGLIVTFVGLIAILISLFRIRSKDFSLLSFGFFTLTYGIRWLVQTPTMKTMVGFPFTYPYFDTFLTCFAVISLSAFFVQIFGHGIYNSLHWVFISTILYTIILAGYAVFYPATPPSPAMIPFVVILWCVVWAINFIIVKSQSQIELQVLRIVSAITLICVAQDQFVIIHLLPWGFHLEHAGFFVFCIGLAFVASHHFFYNERKLFLIEQEIEIARQIQESNLPTTLHSPEGVDIVARYIPMSTVAGDFYDMQVKDKTGLGILIADVSGHGVGAALIGSMLKIAFDSQAEHLNNPGRVLTEINRILQGKIEHSFVTACYIFINLVNRKISYSNAGHPPPVLWRKSKAQMDRLTVGGTILGPFPNSVYEVATLNIEKDDRLVLYTDGIIETKNKADELFGDERLEELIKEHSSDSAGISADQFLNHLSKWSGRSNQTSLDDDLTLIIVDVVSELKGSPSV